MKFYLVSTEGAEKLGVTRDLATAKKLAREEFHSRYERADLSFEERYDEIYAQKFWMGESPCAILPVMVIDEVEFYDQGTLFPHEVWDVAAEDIPNFLKRQAE
jgi:hypothetical protein